MPAVSKTLGSIHFEDLEPKRFEDLARQLIYDFRNWRRLEATGRGGSDDGFDARGYEIVDASSAPGSADDETEVVVGASDRLWLVQCKREKTITPKKLDGYLDDIKLTEGEMLHGIIFTAACDFSKAARDKFRGKCEALGITDWHLWGKAELEDKLMRPENDGLLFAYFGISLTIRRRSQKSDLRAKLVMKRKADRMLADVEGRFVLLRSPDAEGYPDPSSVSNFKETQPWLIRRYEGLVHDGLKFFAAKYFAYVDDDGKSWDMARAYNEELPSDFENPWHTDYPPNDLAVRSKIHTEWMQFPEKNRAWVEIFGIVPFDAVLDIDDLGDEIFEAPHLYVPFNVETGPYVGFYSSVKPIHDDGNRTLYPKDAEDGRVEKFSKDLRERKK